MRLYETMRLIRRTEERLRDDAAAGKLPGGGPARGAVIELPERTPKCLDERFSDAWDQLIVDGSASGDAWRFLGSDSRRADLDMASPVLGSW